MSSLQCIFAIGLLTSSHTLRRHYLHLCMPQAVSLFPVHIILLLVQRAHLWDGGLFVMPLLHRLLLSFQSHQLYSTTLTMGNLVLLAHSVWLCIPDDSLSDKHFAFGQFCFQFYHLDNYVAVKRVPTWLFRMRFFFPFIYFCIKWTRKCFTA